MIQPLLFLSALTMSSPEYVTTALHQGPAASGLANIMQSIGVNDVRAEPSRIILSAGGSSKQVMREPDHYRSSEACVYAGFHTPTAPQFS
jgi:hypothetical protein